MLLRASSFRPEIRAAADGAAGVLDTWIVTVPIAFPTRSMERTGTRWNDMERHQLNNVHLASRRTFAFVIE
jgi:hypothetical protein